MKYPKSVSDYLTILTVTNLILLFKLFQVTMTSCEDVEGVSSWGYFDQSFGQLFFLLGVTLLGFLV